MQRTNKCNRQKLKAKRQTFGVYRTTSLTEAGAALRSSTAFSWCSPSTLTCTSTWLICVFLHFCTFVVCIFVFFFTNSPRWHWVAGPRAWDLRVCPPLPLEWKHPLGQWNDLGPKSTTTTTKMSARHPAWSRFKLIINDSEKWKWEKVKVCHSPCPAVNSGWSSTVQKSESETLRYAGLKNKIRATNFATWNDPWDVDGGVLLFPTHHVEA